MEVRDKLTSTPEAASTFRIRWCNYYVDVLGTIE
jgi:hypothetical protein